jgi:hypothetical protein
MVHTSIKSATQCLLIDFQNVVVKMYQNFHSYNATVEQIKALCNCVEKCRSVLGKSKTRSLSLLSA